MHIQVTVLYQVLLATPQKVHNITLTILCNTLLNHSTQLQIKEIRINKYVKKNWNDYTKSYIKILGQSIKFLVIF